MSSKKLNDMYMARRTFIKGLASVGLLSSLQVEKLFAQTSAPLRVCFVALQHGWGGGDESQQIGGEITGSEFDFVLPSFWQPFQPLIDDCVFIDGLRGTFWDNAHDISYTEMLSQSLPCDIATSGNDRFPAPVGPSIDWVLEQHYNQSEALRFSAGYRSWGFPYHPLCWTGHQTPQALPIRTRAATAYNDIFRDLLDPANRPDPSQWFNPKQEMFPHLSREANRILNNVPPSERGKLLGYLDAVGVLENRHAGQAPVSHGTADVRRIPMHNDSAGQEIDSFFDMIRVGFANDTHRVAVMGLGESDRSWRWNPESGGQVTGITGVFEDFHQDVAHYLGDADQNNNWIRPVKSENVRRAYGAFTRHHAQKVANFAMDLKNTVDIDGNSLLDNTIIVLTGEVGNGWHNNRRKPHIVIGGGSRINRRRWYQVPQADATSIGSWNSNDNFVSIADRTGWLSGMHSARTPADLYVRIANLAGLNISRFGFDPLNNGPLDI